MSKKISKELLEKFPVYTEMEAPEELSKEDQLEMFHKMSLIRHFDSQVKNLWMDNKIYGLAHAYVAAEAIGVGTCFNLEKKDYISSTHRGHGHTIAKGGNVKKMMAELFGKYEGCNHGKGGSMHIADMEVGMTGATGIVGSGMPIALGASLTARNLKTGGVAVCFHGDGGTNQGVWHESINMAAAWDLPCVFVIENNNWAIGTDIARVVKEQDLYKRAVGYGIEGVQIDGFNVFEVYKTVKKAVKKAREGGGPTLIECRFLRLLGHHVADGQDYRDLEPVEPFWALDPVVRMRDYLVESGTATEEEVAAVDKEASDEVKEAIRYAEEDCTEPSVDTLYTDIYANGEIIK